MSEVIENKIIDKQKLPKADVFISSMLDEYVKESMWNLSSIKLKSQNMNQCGQSFTCISVKIWTVISHPRDAAGKETTRK